MPAKDEAWSTNYDICRVPITGGGKEWETLTKDNQAADSGPLFSPDGKKLAYRSQKRAGFEADKWELMFVNCKEMGHVSRASRELDREVRPLRGRVRAGCGKEQDILFVADEDAQTIILRNSGPNDLAWSERIPWYGMSNSFSASQEGLQKIAFAQSFLNKPAEVVAATTPATSRTAPRSAMPTISSSPNWTCRVPKA